MTHKTKEALDEQQKQSSMTAEELLFELDQIRIKYKGQKFDIEKGSPRIDESIDLINQLKSNVCDEHTGKIVSFLEGLRDSYCDHINIFYALSEIIEDIKNFFLSDSDHKLIE